IAREDNGGVYLHAGPEIGVASTKAFTSQVVALALLTLKLARLRNMSVVKGREIAQAMLELPGQIQSILDRAKEIESIADRFKNATNFLYLGRGYNFPVALEGARRQGQRAHEPRRAFAGRQDRLRDPHSRDDRHAVPDPGRRPAAVAGVL